MYVRMSGSASSAACVCLMCLSLNRFFLVPSRGGSSWGDAFGGELLRGVASNDF